MAGKIGLAQGKYARKTATMGTNWKRGVTGKGGEYCKGVADFIGVKSCNKARESAWTSGVDAVSASDFGTAVRGKEDKWARRYREAMG